MCAHVKDPKIICRKRVAAHIAGGHTETLHTRTRLNRSRGAPRFMGNVGEKSAVASSQAEDDGLLPPLQLP